MGNAIWFALVMAFAALTTSLVVLVSRALRAWRSFRSLARATGRALADVERRAADAEARARAVTDGAARLAGATARAQRSLTELGVLRAAAAEVRSGIGRVRGAVPSK